MATSLPGNEFFADVAHDIIRWMDEGLTDRERGGFYASQDADISLDDDGDYFTWTLDEAEAVLSTDELQVAMLHYDINEVGEMHHNPAKNVLYCAPALKRSRTRKKSPQELQTHSGFRQEEMYAARLLRPTPFIDKTVYVGWNRFAFPPICRQRRFWILMMHGASRCGRWIGFFPRHGTPSACSTFWPTLIPRPRNDSLPGVLDDYAFTAIACLDAYEASADLSYFHFAQTIADAMIARFHDRVGGFFDSQRS